MRSELWRDVSGLGGFPLFAVAAVFAGVAGEGAIVLQLAESLALGYAATAGLKHAYFRPRPEPQAYRDALEKFDANSFPSIHAMRGAVFWTLVGARSASVPLAIVCGFVIALIGFTRVWLKRHHPTDVIAGVLVGLAASGAVLAANGWWGAAIAPYR